MTSVSSILAIARQIYSPFFPTIDGMTPRQRAAIKQKFRSPGGRKRTHARRRGREYDRVARKYGRLAARQIWNETWAPDLFGY